MHENIRMRAEEFCDDGVADCGATRGADLGPETIPFQPTMDIHDIFRAMITAELRAGRLTPGRRKRIVQYAAQLRLSAVEAGRLIDECREAALAGDDEEAKYHALRLVDAPAERVPFAYKLWALVVIAILLDVLLIRRWF